MPPKRSKATSDEDDPSSLTIPQLKQQIEKLGYSHSNCKRKADYVQTLTDARNGKGTKAEEEGEEEEEPKGKEEDKEESKKEEKEEVTKEEEEEKQPKKQKTESNVANKSSAKVDSECKLNGAKVYVENGEAFNAKLNQTNIGNNNNKFYVAQVLEQNGSYYLWTRWGRVGAAGQNSLDRLSSAKEAVNEFKKKFKAKTKNNWDDRGNFKKVKGQYDLLDMADAEDDDDSISSVQKTEDGKAVKVKPCTLDSSVQKLIKLIFDKDMFKNQMKSQGIDTERMPLGKMNKSQLDKGFAALEALQKEIKGGNSKSKIEEHCDAFYTSIPHAFSISKRPPLITTLEEVQKKMDMLEILGDICLAKNLADKPKEDFGDAVEHVLDVNYKKLNNPLKVLDKKSDEFSKIEKYWKNTCGHGNYELLEVYELNRDGEDKRFSLHKDITNRKLLWHGTNAAVVVAILSSGLRIMPHSGGRVGRGIYFASEMAKSAGYVGPTQSEEDGNKNVGFMFLNEVALGKEHSITKDDSSLREAPKGFDCVIARGQTEPDSKEDTTIPGKYGDVVVPQGKPIKTEYDCKSSFSHSEYLVYKESQVFMRYLLKFKWRY